MRPPSTLFGSRARTSALLLIALLEETYASEVARALGLSLFSIQRILQRLEEEGVLVGRTIGRERRLSLDPRFWAAAELQALLLRLATKDEEVFAAAASIRRRPRARGKEI